MPDGNAGSELHLQHDNNSGDDDDRHGAATMQCLDSTMTTSTMNFFNFEKCQSCILPPKMSVLNKLLIIVVTT